MLSILISYFRLASSLLTSAQISMEDVTVEMREMDMSRTAAELALRENKGNLEAALRALINA